MPSKRPPVGEHLSIPKFRYPTSTNSCSSGDLLTQFFLVWLAHGFRWERSVHCSSRERTNCRCCSEIGRADGMTARPRSRGQCLPFSSSIPSAQRSSLLLQITPGIRAFHAPNEDSEPHLAVVSSFQRKGSSIKLKFVVGGAYEHASVIRYQFKAPLPLWKL